MGRPRGRLRPRRGGYSQACAQVCRRPPGARLAFEELLLGWPGPPRAVGRSPLGRVCPWRISPRGGRCSACGGSCTRTTASRRLRALGPRASYRVRPRPRSENPPRPLGRGGRRLRRRPVHAAFHWNAPFGPSECARRGAAPTGEWTPGGGPVLPCRLRGARARRRPVRNGHVG